MGLHASMRGIEFHVLQPARPVEAGRHSLLRRLPGRAVQHRMRGCCALFGAPRLLLQVDKHVHVQLWGQGCCALSSIRQAAPYIQSSTAALPLCGRCHHDTEVCPICFLETLQD